MIQFIKSKWFAFIVGIFALLFGANSALAAVSMSQPVVNLNSNVVGVSTNHTISFTTSSAGAIGSNGQIIVVYPTGFNLSNVTLGSHSGNLGNATLSRSGNILTITLGFNSYVSSSNSVSFQLLGIINSSTAGKYSTVIKTQNSMGVTIDGPTGSATFGISTSALNTISISPSANQNIIAGQTIQFYATGYDQFGNPLTGISFIWTGTNSQGLFNTTTIGTYTISVASGSINSNSVIVTVNPASLAFISINPSQAQTIISGQTIQFTAQGYDNYNNAISGLVYNWHETNNEGKFNNTNAGIYLVRAENNGIFSASILVTVLAASSNNDQEQSTQPSSDGKTDNQDDESSKKEETQTIKSKTSGNLTIKKTETASGKGEQEEEINEKEIATLDMLEPLIGASSTQKTTERNWWVPVVIAFLVLVAAYYGYIALVGAQKEKDISFTSNEKPVLAKKTNEKPVFNKPSANKIGKKEEKRSQNEKATEMTTEEKTEEIKPINEEDKTRW